MREKNQVQNNVHSLLTSTKYSYISMYSMNYLWMDTNEKHWLFITYYFQHWVFRSRVYYFLNVKMS